MDLAEYIKSHVSLQTILSAYCDKPPKAIRGSLMYNCPLHEDNTPSLSITPYKQLWHCFSCGEGGDVIRLAMKLNNCNFVDAVKVLILDFSIPPPARMYRDEFRNQLKTLEENGNITEALAFLENMPKKETHGKH